MKNSCNILIQLILSFLALNFAKAQNIQFEDANFKAELLKASPENGIARDANGNTVMIDTNGDGEISQAEALNIDWLIIDGWSFYSDKLQPVDSLQITSMKGIEYFTNLTMLHCRNLYLLKSLDVSALTKLKELNCSSWFYRNRYPIGTLSSLVLPKTATLESLDCSSTSISSLDFLLGIPNLKKLDLSYLNIENLNITGTQFPHLKELSISQSIPNVAITVSDLPELTKFYTSSSDSTSTNIMLSNLPKIDTLKNIQAKNITINNLPNLASLGFDCESLVLNNVPKLTEIAAEAWQNKLKTLDLSNVPNLVTLSCRGMPWRDSLSTLENVNLSKNINLQTLSLRFNYKLQTLDVSKNINLQMLELEFTGIQTLDVSKNINLRTLSLNSIGIKTLDVSKNINLQELNLDSAEIKTLDVSKIINLQRLGLSRTRIKTLNVSKNINLQDLRLGGTGIETLDVSKNINLQGLWLNGTGMKILDISKNINLQTLYLWNNIGIKILDISKNINLQELSLFSNPEIKTLDISNNAQLRSLQLFKTKIKTLDLSKNINLEWLNFKNNDSLQTLDLSKNINLTRLNFEGNNNLQTLDISKNINLQGLRILNNTEIKTLDVSHNINLNFLQFDGCTGLTSLYMKNGVKKNFESFGYGFYGTNLNYICCDEDEIDTVKTYMRNKDNLTVTSDCGTEIPPQKNKAIPK